MGRRKKQDTANMESRWDVAKELGLKEFSKEVSKGRGQPKKIASPAKMWEYAMEYFKYVDANPHKKVDFIKSGDFAGTLVRLPTIMPYTWMGFESWLTMQGIIESIDKYKSNTDDGYTNFRGVINKIDIIMRAQKFEGAAVGAFNANIISADLGLMRKEAEENARASELKIIIEDKTD